MIKKIALALALIVVAFAIVVALQPADFSITRSIRIIAPPDAAFAQVNDFHKWENWSPWAKLDPNMKTTYAGPGAGAGAVYTWAGASAVGEGRMTIPESHPSDLIRIELVFQKPMAATNTTEFTFTPEASETLVKWTMTGKNGFGGKAFNLLMNMDKIVGGDFEKGLAQLKAIVDGKATSTRQ